MKTWNQFNNKTKISVIIIATIIGISGTVYWYFYNKKRSNCITNIRYIPRQEAYDWDGDGFSVYYKTRDEALEVCLKSLKKRLPSSTNTGRFVPLPELPKLQQPNYNGPPIPPDIDL